MEVFVDRLRSLAYQTDLFFHHFNGIVEKQEDYLTIRTPSNPGFYWGNFILFRKAPKAGDLLRWQDIFKYEFDSSPLVTHQAFGWDETSSDRGKVEDFQKAGFNVNKSVVLTAGSVRAPSVKNDFKVRTLQLDWEWEAAFENQLAVGKKEHNDSRYSDFKYKQMKAYRKMSEAGLGNWYGAFLGDQLVGDLGLFISGGIGRFQSVETHPEFRRQGVCGTLVYQVSKEAFRNKNVKTLVMVADEEYHAAKIYESVGFQPSEHQSGVCLAPQP